MRIENQMEHVDAEVKQTKKELIDVMYNLYVYQGHYSRCFIDHV